QKNMEFFGSDDPQGSPIVASNIVTDPEHLIKKGVITPVKINIQDGNQGVYIRSIQVAGPNATDFEIKSGSLNNSLLKPNSSHEITAEYVGTDVESSAVLRIEYGNSSIKEI